MLVGSPSVEIQASRGARSRSCRSVRYAQTAADLPDHLASLLGSCVQQGEFFRNDGLAVHFETGSAGGLIDDVARNDGLFRVDDDRGDLGDQAARRNPYESAIFAHGCIRQRW